MRSSRKTSTIRRQFLMFPPILISFSWAKFDYMSLTCETLTVYEVPPSCMRNTKRQNEPDRRSFIGLASDHQAGLLYSTSRNVYSSLIVLEFRCHAQLETTLQPGMTDRGLPISIGRHTLLYEIGHLPQLDKQATKQISHHIYHTFQQFVGVASALLNSHMKKMYLMRLSALSARSLAS